MSVSVSGGVGRREEKMSKRRGGDEQEEEEEKSSQTTPFPPHIRDGCCLAAGLCVSPAKKTSLIGPAKSQLAPSYRVCISSSSRICTLCTLLYLLLFLSTELRYASGCPCRSDLGLKFK